MREKILIVEDCFALEGRRVVVVGQSELKYQDLKSGTSVIIVRPDESEIETIIRGNKALVNQKECFASNNKLMNIGLLLADVTKADVPIKSIIIKK